MYSYEEFKEIATERLTKLVQKEYPDVKVEQKTMPIKNQMEEYLMFTKQGDGIGASPSFEWKGVYEDYVCHEDFESVIEWCRTEICDNLKFAQDVMEAFNDYSGLKNRITFELMHTEQNREFLEQAPHREFLDLSIVYNFHFQNENVSGSALITNKLAEKLGMTEEDLYVMGYENTKQVHKPIVRPLGDVILYTMLHGEGESNLEEIPEYTQNPALKIYMLTNCERQKGAASLLYPEELEKLAKKLDSDLYILPSSVHEVLIVNAQEFQPDNLAQTVYEMNKNMTSIEERLSNQVYFYNRQTQEISLATDTEHTMLLEEHETEPERDVGMAMGV